MATCLAILLTVADPGHVRAEDDAAYCIPPGTEAQTTALIADPGFGVRIPDEQAGDAALSFESISIEKNVVTFTLARLEGENAAAVAHVTLRPSSAAGTGDRRSKHFAVGTLVLEDSPTIRSAVDRAVESILANDSADYYRACEGPPGSHGDSDAQQSDGGPLLGVWSVVAAVLLLLGAALANFMRGKREKTPKEPSAQ